jgi:hypothetical protein
MASTLPDVVVDGGITRSFLPDGLLISHFASKT